MESEGIKQVMVNLKEDGDEAKKDAWENLSSKAARHYYKNVTRFTSLHATDLIMSMYPYLTKPNITILDIGCGPATFGLAYLKHFPKGIKGQTLIMTDLSEGMVKEAQHVMKEHVCSSSEEEFQTRLEYQVEDGSVLKGIKDDSIDVVVSVFGIFVIPDHVSTLNAIARVLKPRCNEVEGASTSGVFGTAVWTISEHHQLFEDEGFGPSFHMVIEDSMKQLTDFGSGEDTWKRWFSINNIRRMIIDDDAGDKYDANSLKIHKSVHTVVWPSSQELWNMIETNPLSKINEHPAEIVASSKQNLFESLSKAAGSNSVSKNDKNNPCDTLTSVDTIAEADADASRNHCHYPVKVVTASNLVIVKLSPS